MIFGSSTARFDLNSESSTYARRVVRHLLSSSSNRSFFHQNFAIQASHRQEPLPFSLAVPRFLCSHRHYTFISSLLTLLSRPRCSSCKQNIVVIMESVRPQFPSAFLARGLGSTNINNNNSMARKQKQPPPATMVQQPVKQARTGGGLIQSNSIQQQFATLANDRDKFRQEKQQAENALVHVQAEYQTLKKDQDDLIVKNLHVQAELGTYTKKLAMLREEEKRVQKSLENDTKAVENCTNHLKSLESNKQDKEKKFVAYLNPVTVEIAIFLQKRIEKKVEAGITVETVSSVLLPFLQTKQEDGSPDLQRGLFGLDESIDALKEATVQRDAAAAQLRELLVNFQDMGVDLDDVMKELVQEGFPAEAAAFKDDANYGQDDTSADNEDMEQHDLYDEQDPMASGDGEDPF